MEGALQNNEFVCDKSLIPILTPVLKHLIVHIQNRYKYQFENGNILNFTCTYIGGTIKFKQLYRCKQFCELKGKLFNISKTLLTKQSFILFLVKPLYNSF